MTQEQEHTHIPHQELDPVIAQALATRLFQHEMELIAAARRLLGGRIVGRIGEHALAVNENDVISVGVDTPLLEGVGGGLQMGRDGMHHVTVHHTESKGRYSPNIGFDTPVHVEITVHTDEPTREQVTQQAQEHRRYYALTAFLRTDYYFTQDGKYAKVVHIPSYIRDPRPSLAEDMFIMKKFGSMRKVAAPMKAGDFELANSALIILREAMQVPGP